MKPIHIAVAMTLVAAGCDSEAGFPDARLADAAPPPGTFSLSWTVTDTTDSMSITCDEANATTVSISVREQGAGVAQTEVFNCSSGMAPSRPYPPGTYELDFSLRGPDGAVATAPQMTGVVIMSGQDTPIGAIDFGVVANGGLDLTLLAVAAMDNCGPIATMGGGIDEVTLTLSRDATCVPFDYTVNAGAPVTTTCPATPVACIERDDDVVAAVLDSGRYQIEAIGLIGTAECWVGAREVRVPTDGMVATFNLSMVYQPLVVGCPPMP